MINSIDQVIKTKRIELAEIKDQIKMLNNAEEFLFADKETDKNKELLYERLNEKTKIIKSELEFLDVLIYLPVINKILSLTETEKENVKDKILSVSEKNELFLEKERNDLHITLSEAKEELRDFEQNEYLVNMDNVFRELVGKSNVDPDTKKRVIAPKITIAEFIIFANFLYDSKEKIFTYCEQFNEEKSKTFFEIFYSAVVEGINQLKFLQANNMNYNSEEFFGDMANKIPHRPDFSGFLIKIIIMDGILKFLESVDESDYEYFKQITDLKNLTDFAEVKDKLKEITNTFYPDPRLKEVEDLFLEKKEDKKKLITELEEKIQNTEGNIRVLNAEAKDDLVFWKQTLFSIFNISYGDALKKLDSFKEKVVIFEERRYLQSVLGIDLNTLQTETVKTLLKDINNIHDLVIIKEYLINIKNKTNKSKEYGEYLTEKERVIQTHNEREQRINKMETDKITLRQDLEDLEKRNLRYFLKTAIEEKRRALYETNNSIEALKREQGSLDTKQKVAGSALSEFLFDLFEEEVFDKYFQEKDLNKYTNQEYKFEEESKYGFLKNIEKLKKESASGYGFLVPDKLDELLDQVIKAIEDESTNLIQNEDDAIKHVFKEEINYELVNKIGFILKKEKLRESPNFNLNKNPEAEHEAIIWLREQSNVDLINLYKEADRIISDEEFANILYKYELKENRYYSR